jgi:hypothetical protein
MSQELGASARFQNFDKIVDSTIDVNTRTQWLRRNSLTNEMKVQTLSTSERRDKPA